MLKENISHFTHGLTKVSVLFACLLGSPNRPRPRSFFAAPPEPMVNHYRTKQHQEISASSIGEQAPVANVYLD